MIRLDNIVKSFAGQTVLDGVSLELAEGGVTALIGPSGSGKSTLLRCANLLEVPDAGELRLAGEALRFEAGRKLPRDAILRVRRITGMVFQSFQLFPHQTALQNVMEGLIAVQRWPHERAQRRALELLDKVGMAHKAQAWPATLSGGQQQRVAIARALAPSPQLLLCDEPTSALDPELAAEVVAVLRQLAAEGVTMLMATHDLRLAASVARDVVFLERGRIVEAGGAAQIFRQPREARTAEYVATLTAGAREAALGG
ncbi:amino acid ABC transporter ATP-binding protein [Chromobacterium sphagni]|uniref:ATP-binding protein n=1 Tax=Chromobacterium sphagni TaxID=1903179 RepID=A0A1S1WWD5_9NEIS|nr:amino acid ABC transporter ATP-binding protein [Chromobacterium sphagni]OHX11466.1 ATP-binding protein [Chromobacterium sphagni]OHX20916.1 ATP-binding protein [Chromobacterium sphagni]